MSNIDKKNMNPEELEAALRELKRISEQPAVTTHYARVLRKYIAILEGGPEAVGKRIAELPGQKRLIGWRMADYTDETADPVLAKNWATAVDVLPIFEGDVNTKLTAAAAGKGEAS